MFSPRGQVLAAVVLTARSLWHNARRNPVKPKDTVSRTVFSGMREYQEERSMAGMRK